MSIDNPYKIETSENEENCDNIQKNVSILETYLQERGYEILYLETNTHFSEYSLAIWLTPRYVIGCHIPYKQKENLISLNWLLYEIVYNGLIENWPHFSQHRFAKIAQYGQYDTLDEILKRYKLL